MMQRGQIMNAQTANAILLQQQQQQRRLQQRGNNGPTVIPHNSPNVESQLLCTYSQYLCKREKVQGHEFCARHILEDKNSAFKQCNFQFRNHKRCPRPAPKTDRKDGYCVEHTRKAMVARSKALRKRPNSEAVHRHLDELAHYKRPKVESTDSSLNGSAPGPSASKVSDFEDLEKEVPTFEIDTRPSLKIPSPPLNRAFDFGSEESDEDQSTVEASWRGDGDSDAESVDSEMENPLKHAGAYSAEEVIRIMRDKLIRLQKLYIDQFQRLQYLLKEERRQYRVSLRKEHEAELMSIHRQPKESKDDKVSYDHLKSLNHYNRPAGVEAVLHAKLMERRIRLSEANANLMQNNLMMPGSLAGKLATPSMSSSSNASLPKCSFNITSSLKCGDACIPMTKFCLKHILNDPNQVLFRQCGVVVASEDENATDDGPCETPIPDVLDSSSCVYHTQFQPSFPTSLVEMDHHPSGSQVKTTATM